MHDQDIRKAVLLLGRQGNSQREIAAALTISRHAVRGILQAGAAEIPKTERPSLLAPHHDELVQLRSECRGNLVRVHEIFAERHGLLASYATLARYMTGVGLGKPSKPPVGEYHFAPGEEMQHDTSPHTVVLGGRDRVLQCASLVLGHSRMLYAQVFEQFTRLQARIFLTEALQYFGGVAKRCVVDNTSVIRLRGVGADMEPAPEMASFAKHYDFSWLAHELNDPDRKARVERSFGYIEGNFYRGRTFADLADCNAQLRAWCDKVNGEFRRRLRAKPVDLFVADKAALRALPLYMPEPYGLNLRVVDQSAFVSLHTNRYSVPADRMGRQVEVREYKANVRIFEGPRMVAEHPLLPFGEALRSHLPQHRVHGLPRAEQRQQPCEAETRLRRQAPELTGYIDGLRKRKPGRAVRALLHLARLWDEYPHASVTAAVKAAIGYDMYDLGRLERMVLRQTRGDLFGLPLLADDDLDHNQGGDDA